jgi:hypothetical protein
MLLGAGLLASIEWIRQEQGQPAKPACFFFPFFFEGRPRLLAVGWVFA